jgi:Tfp pilus assembly protein PilW
MPADAFVVHGKRNPEGGIRRWAKSECAEVAKNTLYPNGVPANLSDNNATPSGSSAYAAATPSAGLASTLGVDTSTLAKRNHGLFDAGAVYQMTIGDACPLWSPTTKQASNSSIVHGGGNRRTITTCSRPATKARRSQFRLRCRRCYS